MNKSRIGFLVNPVAGMGGAVGLKGTDSRETLDEALRRGAQPVAPARAAVFLNALRTKLCPSSSDAGSATIDSETIHWFTAGGAMGEDLLNDCGFSTTGHPFTVVHTPADPTGPADTRNAVDAMIDAQCSLIVFVGGDGTARDVADAVQDRCLVMGIPSGVKMYSGVFTVRPDAAAALLFDHIQGTASPGEVAILDIDESAYRAGTLSTRLFGMVRMPFEQALVQAPKGIILGADDGISKVAIAEFFAEELRDETETLFILGAGSTIQAIGEKSNLLLTLVGVDIVSKGAVVQKDATEQQLLKEIADFTKNHQNGAIRIVITPIGAQGFVFGRGNPQISPAVIRHVLDLPGERGAIIIAATPLKLKRTPTLRVDTGDAELDMRLTGFRKVVVGYREMTMRRIE